MFLPQIKNEMPINKVNTSEQRLVLLGHLLPLHGLFCKKSPTSVKHLVLRCTFSKKKKKSN